MANLAFFVIVLALWGLAFRRPGIACGYVLAGYALEQFAQAFVPIAGENDTLCNYAIAIAVIVGVVRRIMRHGLLTIRLRTPALLMLVLLAYCYATALWSLFPSITQRILDAQLPYLVIFAGLTPVLVATPEDLDDCLTSLIVSTSISLCALLLFAEWGRRGVILPFQGWESNPLAITQAAGALLIAAIFSRTLRSLNQSTKMLGFLTILAIVAFTFLRSASRGQIVAAISTALLFSVTRKGLRWVPMVLVGIAGIVAAGFLADEFARNAARWEPDQVSHDLTVARIGEAEKLVRFWSNSNLKHILLGLGHATSNDPRLLGGYPHVVPAEVLAEEGLVGASLYTLTLASSAYFYVRALRWVSAREHDLIRATAALTFYEFLLTLKQGTLLGAPSFLLLIVLSGSLDFSKERMKRSTHETDKEKDKSTPFSSSMGKHADLSKTTSQ